MYNFDLLALITDVLLWMLRKARQLAWIVALNQTIYDEYGKLLNEFEGWRFEAQITGQVGSLEYMLNNHYYGNGLLTNIYITDGTGDNDTFLFNQSENEAETYIFNASEAEDDLFIFNADEFSGDADFTVFIPDTLPPTITGDYSIAMKALINKFKIAGTSYTIQTY